MEQRLAASDLSLNAPARRDDGGAEVGDFLPGTGSNAEERVGDAEMRRVFRAQVESFAKNLDDRELRILEERVLAAEPRTLQELGRDFGVSRERVRQLEARLVDRLSAHLKEHMIDFDFYAAPRD
jgi:RNA polymerase sigma-32 factor